MPATCDLNVYLVDRWQTRRRSFLRMMMGMISMKLGTHKEKRSAMILETYGLIMIEKGFGPRIFYSIEIKAV